MRHAERRHRVEQRQGHRGADKPRRKWRRDRSQRCARRLLIGLRALSRSLRNRQRFWKRSLRTRASMSEAESRIPAPWPWLAICPPGLSGRRSSCLDASRRSPACRSKATANLSRSATIRVFKPFGVGERAAVGEFAAGVDRRVLARAVPHVLHDPPAADGVVLVERQAEGVDLAVAAAQLASSRWASILARSEVFGWFGGVGLIAPTFGRGRRRRVADRSTRGPTCLDGPAGAGCRQR